MAEERKPSDTELWSHIWDQAHKAGVRPHAVIRREVEEYFKKEHDEIEKDMAACDRSELEEADPLYRAELRRELDWQRTEMRYNLDLHVRQRVADLEKVFLKEEIAALGPRLQEDAAVAERVAAVHMKEDAELLAKDSFDLVMREHEDWSGYHDEATTEGVRALQSCELENLKGRQHVEILRLSREIAQEESERKEGGGMSRRERLAARLREERDRESDLDKGRER